MDTRLLREDCINKDWVPVMRRDISPRHIYFIYFGLSLSILMGVFCLVLCYRLNQHQTTLEHSLGFSARKGCCTGCSSTDIPGGGTNERESTLPEEEWMDAEETMLHFRSLEGDESRTGVTESGHDMSPVAETRNSVEGVEQHDPFTRAENEFLVMESQRLEHSGKVRRNVEGSGLVPLEVKFLSESHESTKEPTHSHSSDYTGKTRFSRETGRTRDRNSDELPAQSIQTTAPPNVERRRKNLEQRSTKDKSPDTGITGLKGMARQENKRKQLRQKFRMSAIHLHASEDMERQYESGPAISLNGSNSRDTVYRFWKKASWVDNSVTDVFHLDEVTGHVTIEIEGLYLIYAQVVYHDLSGRWSFGIYVGDQERVKCLATEQLRDLHNFHPTSHGVYQSCYTAIVLHVRKNQSVSIRCMYGSRTILTRPEFTFWGIVRLS